MKKKVRTILDASRTAGWVLEPLAKELLGAYGLSTTRFRWAKTIDEAVKGANELGYPVVAKIVSPDIVHKSDVGGVVVGVDGDEALRKVFGRISKLQGFEGILLDETVRGLEFIVGAKEDPQFGTVVLMGLGGTSVEIYGDVALRMAPVSPETAREALRSLQGRKLLEGYRGKKGVNLDGLVDLVVRFSKAAYALHDEIDSIDLNPVFCDAERAVVADARILLKK